MRDQRVILGESDDPDRDYQDYRSLTISTYVEVSRSCRRRPLIC